MPGKEWTIYLCPVCEGQTSWPLDDSLHVRLHDDITWRCVNRDIDFTEPMKQFPVVPASSLSAVELERDEARAENERWVNTAMNASFLLVEQFGERLLPALRDEFQQTVEDARDIVNPGWRDDE